MENYLNEIRDKIMQQLVEREKDFKMDYFNIDESVLPRRIEAAFKTILKNNKISLARNDQENLLAEIISYFIGLGPINDLLNDPDITEIMVNGPKQVYVERKGSIELSGVTFRDEQQLAYFIEKIVTPLGRRISQFEPYVDARLKDGSRVNIIKAPVSSIGSILTIRKFNYRKLSLEDLVNSRTLNNAVADFLKACIVSRLNILISGGASTGKTTLLNALGSLIPDTERVITIEDTRELSLTREHTVPLETRTPNIEGKGEITIRYLIRNSLHMRPDRIIIGEVRSEEVLDMIQAMNTGHEGSLTTLHANSSLEALDRLEVLSLLANSNMSSEVAKRQIISAIDLIIHMQRFSDGTRKIVQIGEVIKSKEYQLNDIVAFNEKSGENTAVFTGKVPEFYKKLKENTGYSCKDFEVK